jgi:hypothetical protein
MFIFPGFVKVLEEHVMVHKGQTLPKNPLFWNITHDFGRIFNDHLKFVPKFFVKDCHLEVRPKGISKYFEGHIMTHRSKAEKLSFLENEAPYFSFKLPINMIVL